jgi:hypothetical protein
LNRFDGGAAVLIVSRVPDRGAGGQHGHDRGAVNLGEDAVAS